MRVKTPAVLSPRAPLRAGRLPGLMAVLCMVGTVGVTLADTPAGGASPATGVQTGRTVGAEVRTVAGSGQLRVAVTGPTRGWVPAHIPGWARRGPGVAHRTSTGHARLSTTTVDNVLETTNWSGLIDAGTTFTGVSGKWVVPAVRPSTTTQVSSTWVGIDGFSNSSLIQTGTTQATSGGSTSYFAWYEILPADAVPIFTVQPGDVVQASVTRATSGTWTISIDDLTAREAFSHPYSFSGPRASAEWIEEAPTDGLTDKLYPLARFGTVPFSNLSVSGADTGSTYVTPVDMIDTAQDVIAYPSNFASGAFTVTRGTPPVPTASLSVDPNPATAGQNVRYSVSVRGPGGTPTGTVLFLTGDTDLCLVVLVNGQGGCVADSAPTGNDPVDALYFRSQRALVAEREAACVVVGLPLSLSGGETAQTAETRDFAARLKRRLGDHVEVVLHDERLTTRLAQRDPSAQASEDSRAAAHLLEDWLARRERQASAGHGTSG